MPAPRRTRTQNKRHSPLPRLLLMLAPVLVRTLTRSREKQRRMRGPGYRPSRREQLFDLTLDQAGRFFGGRKGRGRGWF